MVSRPVCLGVKQPSGAQDQISNTVRQLQFVDVGRHLWREDRSHDHILLSEIRDSPNLEGQVPVFTLPRNRVAKSYPQALDTLFLASYVSQEYGVGIRNHLHAGQLG
jgi:hypothetical protein